jgi:hypothetical protein
MKAWVTRSVKLLHKVSNGELRKNILLVYWSVQWCSFTLAMFKLRIQLQSSFVGFQVLTAASMMFRVVFWVILPCKMIIDRRFRGAYCLHHQGWVSQARKDRGLYRSPVPRRPVVVRDDRLGTGQWQWVVGSSRREREVYRERMSSGFNSALGRSSLIPDDGGSTHLWNVGRQSFYTAV